MRALNGEEVPHYYQGELIGTHRRYDNRLAMFLLRYRDPLHYAATLDRMVYSGHPEGAALAFAKARDRCADEAWGVADQSIEDVPPEPFEKKPVAQVQAEQLEETLIANSDIPVGGSYERRERIRLARAERYRNRTPEQIRADDEADMRAQIQANSRRWRDQAKAFERSRAGADMPSSSSTSAADAGPGTPPRVRSP